MEPDKWKIVIIMHNLTQRQVEILRSLIEEYIEAAGAVGSETLEKKHNLSASPATIRNEMVRLTDLGYLKKPHTSAGRVPTPMGMKFYVTQLMKEKEMSVTEEVALKEKVWDHRSQTQKFMHELTKTLAEKTHTLAVAISEDGEFYSAGYPYILDMPECYDIDITKGLLTAVDESDLFAPFFTKAFGDEDVHILLGDDLGPRLKGPYGFVFTHYETPNHKAGEIGVIGPARLKYTSIVPVVRYCGGLINEIAEGW